MDQEDGSEEERIKAGGIQVLIDCSFKLGLRRETTATAALLYHKFYSHQSCKQYDVNLVAASCLSLAGKTSEDTVTIRDVVNVFYSTLNPNSEPLNQGSAFESLQQSISSLEHIVLHCLSFRVTNCQSHRYLLHCLKSLQDWLQITNEQKVLLARTCWSLLNDFYCSPKCLKHESEGIAVAVISLSLKLHNISVAGNETALLTWNEVLHEDLSKDKISEITRDLMLTYEQMMCKT